jgi:hypothetical protein
MQEHPRRHEALLGQLPTDVGRFDRSDPSDISRVERGVESGAETDFDDIPGQTFAHLPPQWLDRLHTARDVDDSREDVLTVKADCLHAFRRAVYPPIDAPPTLSGGTRLLRTGRR